MDCPPTGMQIHGIESNTHKKCVNIYSEWFTLFKSFYVPRKIVNNKYSSYSYKSVLTVSPLIIFYYLTEKKKERKLNMNLINLSFSVQPGINKYACMKMIA